MECETYIRYKKPKQRHINRQLVQKSFEKTKHYAKTRSLLYKQRYTNTKISSEETKLLHYLEASLKKEIYNIMDAKETLFQQLKQDISQTPPDVTNIHTLLQQFIDGLCKFCPSKPIINQKIKNSFPTEIKVEDTHTIILQLIYWIEQFQSPADDTITHTMKLQIKNNSNIETIIDVLSKYYDHTEKVYKDTWDARERLIQGKSVIPPQHIKHVHGKNGVPYNMKTGR